MIRENALVISDVESLQRWGRESGRVWWPRRLPAVQFQFREISDEQNKNFSTLANGYRNACGCASSGFFMTVAVVGLVAAYFMDGNRFSDIHLWDILFLAGAAALAALTGKLMGLFWAKWRWSRLAARMHALVAAAKRSVVTKSV